MQRLPRSLSFYCLLVIVILTVWAAESSARPQGNHDSSEGAQGPGEMTDALKYLEELDKYYSQVARPSNFHQTAKRELLQTMEKRMQGEGKGQNGRFLQIQGLDTHLAHMSRPRFGKRSSMGARFPAEIIIPGLEHYSE